ncbi:hypothetical protein LX69_00014 [Breznakibacter xylanolyticus]|uniref:Uncharacterized protein n=1 Tax=Breznakibacter xylanolyticus TaxID=990 RepID=A0A2W7NVE7_9BACT|nr:hypothetical protein [Breznakibacter xylanolyticus]PZX20594.1 hypothetical protein LX69_00014 [Breznakibacter xylanolyticus]
MNKLNLNNKEVEFDCSIERIIEFTNTIIVSYYPQTDEEFYEKGMHGGVCGIDKIDAVVKWKLTYNPLGMRKISFNGKEALNMRIGDVIYILDPDSGKIIYESATKG